MGSQSWYIVNLNFLKCDLISVSYLDLLCLLQARIKAKAITSAPFTTSYKNGVVNSTEADSYNTQNVNQTQQQNPVQYTYANVPNEGFNNQQVITGY